MTAGAITAFAVQFLADLLSSGGRMPISGIARKDCPDDAGGSVGDRDRREANGVSGERRA